MLYSRAGLRAIAALIFAAAAIGLLIPFADAGEPAGEEEGRQIKAGDRDHEFLLRVNDSVRKGMEWLISKQDPDGSFKIHYSTEFPGAPTAFALLALLKAGVPRFDPVIEKGFAFLRQTPLKKTYCVSFTIMALEARWSELKIEERIQGTAAVKPGKGKMPKEDFEWMREMVAFLLANMAYQSDLRDQNGTYLTRKCVWRYPGPAEVGDHSNTQYALLALRAAKNCGIPVPPEIWVEILDHFVQCQEKDGPPVARVKMIEDRKHGYVSYKAQTGVPDKARGWCYSTYLEAKKEGPEEQCATGSMTGIGVASLIIAMECLQGNSLLNSKRASEAQKGVYDGLAWLDNRFAVDTNPGHPNGSWVYYYLYGLERACVLAGTRNLGKRDWYREGAEWLMSVQEASGAWLKKSVDPLEGTGFALLFLTRATIPGRVKITR